MCPVAQRAYMVVGQTVGHHAAQIPHKAFRLIGAPHHRSVEGQQIGCGIISVMFLEILHEIIAEVLRSALIAVGHYVLPCSTLLGGNMTQYITHKTVVMVVHHIPVPAVNLQASSIPFVRRVILHIGRCHESAHHHPFPIRKIPCQAVTLQFRAQIQHIRRAQHRIRRISRRGSPLVIIPVRERLLEQFAQDLLGIGVDHRSFTHLKRLDAAFRIDFEVKPECLGLCFRKRGCDGGKRVISNLRIQIGAVGRELAHIPPLTVLQSLHRHLSAHRISALHHHRAQCEIPLRGHNRNRSAVGGEPSVGGGIAIEHPVKVTHIFPCDLIRSGRYRSHRELAVGKHLHILKHILRMREGNLTFSPSLHFSHNRAQITLALHGAYPRSSALAPSRTVEHTYLHPLLGGGAHCSAHAFIPFRSLYPHRTYRGGIPKTLEPDVSAVYPRTFHGPYVISHTLRSHIARHPVPVKSCRHRIPRRCENLLQFLAAVLLRCRRRPGYGSVIHLLHCCGRCRRILA